jgi:hypothetical protein
MNPLLLGGLFDLAGKVFDKIFPNPQQAAEAKLKLFEMQQAGELKLLEGQVEIITAEAKSESWLASSWRPITMLVFTGLIVARWFGWAAPNLSPEEYIKLWSIVELGLGGYVIGRSAEKIAPAIASAFKK